MVVDTTAAPLGRRRNTRQAEAIEAVLRDADGFRTAQQIHDEVRSRGAAVGLTTVYRHVNLLADLGRADVVQHGDGESRYRLCGARGAGAPGVAGGGPDAAPHHHHVVCRACGRSVEVRGPEVEEWAERVAGAAGFTDVTHTVEVFGLCPEHSAAPPS